MAALPGRLDITMLRRRRRAATTGRWPASATSSAATDRSRWTTPRAATRRTPPRIATRSTSRRTSPRDGPATVGPDVLEELASHVGPALSVQGGVHRCVQPHAVARRSRGQGARLDNTCTASVTSCTVTSDRFGQILNTRAARSGGRIHVVLV